ncbi:MAG: hypothetical protein JL56_07435 [Desulfotomaculum sp. BICA1-6]|nr:MAG: hypothetical protein JL56_07435 [Desulfotomaculum sp. BICA1-6]
MKKTDRIKQEKAEAKQGDFFFALFVTNDGKLRERPVFVAGAKGNDSEDVIICSCTTSPPRDPDFDKKVILKRETYVRTNKLYTIRRDDLINKLRQGASPEDIQGIVNQIKMSFDDI